MFVVKCNVSRQSLAFVTCGIHYLWHSLHVAFVKCGIRYMWHSLHVAFVTCCIRYICHLAWFPSMHFFLLSIFTSIIGDCFFWQTCHKMQAKLAFNSVWKRTTGVPLRSRVCFWMKWRVVCRNKNPFYCSVKYSRTRSHLNLNQYQQLPMNDLTYS